MSPEQWATLASFKDQKKDTAGRLIEVEDYSYLTMSYLNVLVRRLGYPIQLIRGHHGPDGSAVDWTCPGVSYQRLAMEVLSLPLAVGLYSGMSVHTDSRPIVPYTRPARWLAVHEDEEEKLGDMKKLIYRRADGWAYLVWSDVDGLAFKALSVVVQLSEERRAHALGVRGGGG